MLTVVNLMKLYLPLLLLICVTIGLIKVQGRIKQPKLESDFKIETVEWESVIQPIKDE